MGKIIKEINASNGPDEKYVERESGICTSEGGL